MQREQRPNFVYYTNHVYSSINSFTAVGAPYYSYVLPILYNARKHPATMRGGREEGETFFCPGTTGDNGWPLTSLLALDRLEPYVSSHYVANSSPFG